MPNNPPIETPDATPSGGADTPATRQDPARVDPLRNDPTPPDDLSADGGGQRTEAGVPYPKQRDTRQ